MNMGTGILSILIHQSPYQFPGQVYISIAIYLLNCALFVLFAIITIARYTLYPWVFKHMVSNPTQCLFIGTLPMGLATIVNATSLIAVPVFGQWAVDLVWTLWWIDVVLTVLSVILVPIVMCEGHSLTLQGMTAAWLLPIVPAVVAAASGGQIATVLTPSQAAITIIISFVLWGMGFGLSLLIMAVYLHRILVHKLPTHEVIVSAFLPLGPMGQGAFGIIQLGKATHAMVLTSLTGEIVETCLTMVGLIIWGFGMWWLCHGVSSVLIRASTNRLKFNMGFWGFIFPLGVYTTATIDLSVQLSSTFFAVLSAVFIICLVLLYLLVAALTLKDMWNGNLFKAPCLANMNFGLGPRDQETAEASIRIPDGT